MRQGFLTGTMPTFPIAEITISGLQPPGLYEGTTLKFGLVNYFIGKNGSANSQVMQLLKTEIETFATANFAKGILGKFLPTNRTHSITGTREMSGEVLDQYEPRNPTADAFFQFLNESEFTKAMVQGRLNYFFEKSIKITPRGSRIVMDILESWREKERKLIEAAEATTSNISSTLNLSDESDGMKEMLILLTYIYHPRVKVIAIDESELHLHPQMINFVLDAIQDAADSEEKQFFLVTHSPIAIRITSDTHWKYFFFDKKNNKILDFLKFGNPQFSDLIPQLNPFRREVFYCDRVILVEGEQDYHIFHNIAKRIGYSETDGGGYSFFPSWGGYEFERLYNFFVELGKEVFIIADSNILSLAKAGFTQQFKNALSDTNITQKLSLPDIVHLCKAKDTLYPGQTTFSAKQKQEIVREELKRVVGPDFAESDYVEIVQAIRGVLGDRRRLVHPEELTEMFKDLVGTFQRRFASSSYKALFAIGEIESIKEAIKADSQLTKFLQDADRDNVVFELNQGEWRCAINFRNGKHRLRVQFDRETRHAEFEPMMESL